MAGVGLGQFFIGDQFAIPDDLVTLQHTGWLDGDLFGVWGELDALRFALEQLIGSLQKPERSKAWSYPQYKRMWSEYWARRRNVTVKGAIGRNTSTLTSVQVDELFASYTDMTSGNEDPDQRVTRVMYETLDPGLWNLDMREYFWVQFDRDFTRAEVNDFSRGKYRPAVEGDFPEDEQSPDWLDYGALAAAGQITQRLRAVDVPALATKADVRDPNRLITVAPGQSIALLKVRTRVGGNVAVGSRVDEFPVWQRKQEP